jgi:hypothetical protein
MSTTGATGATYSDKNTAAQEALELTKQGLNAVVIGPIDTAFITGPTGQRLPWPAGNSDKYLVIGSDAEIALPKRMSGNP